jgi:coenzyme F420-reducing hydrogenase delta subunit
MLTEILKAYGIDEQRFWLRWIAASEGTMLREVANEMTAKLKELGPSPLNLDAVRGNPEQKIG